MEKKTIGKFIAVLRKANGLTQAELAEKLFVSDKTVSRWERDESTPDLELIPVIADLFGVTTDEILRGERAPVPVLLNNTAKKELDDQREKTEKRYKKLLDRKYLKFKNLSFITIGIVILGIIAAIVCIFCVESEKVDEYVLAGWISIACLVVGTLCQIVFTNLGAYRDDDEEDQEIKEIDKYKVKFKSLAVTYFLILSSVLGATIPVFFIDQVHTDNFNTVLPFICLLFAAVFPLIGYFGFWLHKKNQKQKAELSVEQLKKVSRLKKLVFLPTFGAVLLFLTATVALYYGTSTHDFTKAVPFKTTESFVAYMEQKSDLGDLEKEPFHGSTLQSGGSDGFYFSTYGEWSKLAETDVKFFWANESVIGYTVSNKKDGLPVKVYEKADYRNGKILRKTVIILMPCFAFASAVTGVTVYKVKRKKQGF